MAKKTPRRGGDDERDEPDDQDVLDPNADPQRGDDEPEPDRPTPAAPVPAVTETEVIHPATHKQKITLAALLVAWTLVSLIMAGIALQWLQAGTHADISVDWRRESDAKLAPGPVGFRHISADDCNSESDRLIIIGPLTDEMRLKLVSLFPTADATPPEQEAAYQQDAKLYLTAIDELGTKSIRLVNRNILTLLLLGGCCGMVGVQLRSMWDFVRNICYKDPPQLDIVTWWPWYAMRPLIGFVLGMLAISMIMSGFLEVDNQSPRSNLWWLSITALVGFGASEFMARLRLVVAALFATQG